MQPVLRQSCRAPAGRTQAVADGGDIFRKDIEHKDIFNTKLPDQAGEMADLVPESAVC